MSRDFTHLCVKDLPVDYQYTEGEATTSLSVERVQIAGGPNLNNTTLTLGGAGASQDAPALRVSTSDAKRANAKAFSAVNDLLADAEVARTSPAAASSGRCSSRASTSASTVSAPPEEDTVSVLLLHALWLGLVGFFCGLQ